MSRIKRLVVLISGRGRNLQAIIEAIEQGRLPAQLALVLSNRDDAPGLAHARAAGIATRVIRHVDHPSREAFDAAMLAAIEPLQPDWVALAGFMRILTPGFIGALRGRLINIHPSLLPRYPGLDTHARALAAGDAEHGASVHLVNEQVDGGTVLAQGRITINATDDASRLALRVLDEIEVRLYTLTLRALLDGELDASTTPPRFHGQALQAPLQLVGEQLQPAAS